MKKNFAMLLPMGLLSVILASLVFISCNESTGQIPKAGEEAAKAKDKSSKKVLYVTHEPGRYHDYPAQKAIFLEIAKSNKWETTVMTGTHDEVIQKLATTPDFADGYDVVVYNFCFAKSAKMEAPYNIIEQTKTKGIPAMLIHCSLHSFWPTYRAKGSDAVHAPNAPDKAHTSKVLMDRWNRKNPGKAFPSWPIFTGISSTSHGPKKPIQTENLVADHGALKDVSEYETVNAELYNNFINAKESKKTVPLMKGTQGKSSAVIMWEHPVGKSKTISFTLGHSTEEWKQKEFQQAITSTVEYLIANPSSAKK